MLYDVKSVAQRYHVQPGVVLTWIRRGELSAINVGRKAGGKPRWRIPEEALALFEAARRAGGGNAAQRRARPRRTIQGEYF